MVQLSSSFARTAHRALGCLALVCLAASHGAGAAQAREHDVTTEARQAAEAILATEPGGDPARGASSASFYDAYHALGYVNAAEGRPDEARRNWRRSQTSLRAIGHYAALHQQLYVELSAAVLSSGSPRVSV